MIPEAYINTVLELLPMAKKPVWCKLTGQSMEPLLCHEDSLLVRPGNCDIHIGDIIVFKSHQHQCAHRVVGTTSALGQRVYLTKGDNSYSFDRPVLSGQVLGKVIKAIGNYGPLHLDSISWRFRNFFIAIYSYTEGKRYITGSTFWRLFDRFFSWCHNLTGLRYFHRTDLYRRMVAKKLDSAPIPGGKGEHDNENYKTQ